MPVFSGSRKGKRQLNGPNQQNFFRTCLIIWHFSGKFHLTIKEYRRSLETMHQARERLKERHALETEEQLRRMSSESSGSSSEPVSFSSSAEDAQSLWTWEVN
eukprot:g78891.t1